MNVGLEQTAVDHTKGSTPCTSSSTTSCCLIILNHYFPWQWFSSPTSTPLTCAVFKCNLLLAPAIICHFWAARYTQIGRHGHWRGDAEGQTAAFITFTWPGKVSELFWKITTSNFFGEIGTLVLLPNLFFQVRAPWMLTKTQEQVSRQVQGTGGMLASCSCSGSQAVQAGWRPSISSPLLMIHSMIVQEFSQVCPPCCRGRG